MKFTELSGSVVAPRGFLASGVFCDIKRLGTGKGSDKGQKLDLALIVSEVPATVAGTTKVVPHPKGEVPLPKQDVKIRHTSVTWYEFWKPDAP